jgi:signal transduction histidine kinase/CheY-like chemotaxis protein
MALPLFARGHIVGALDVQSNQPGAFTDEDARILSSLADMVATAIDNARLFALSEEHAEEMAFLFRVTSAAAASPDLEESLEQVMAILQSTWQGTSASVFLPDETGEYMLRGAHVGDPSPETDTSLISVERGLVGWVTRHNQPVLVDDVSHDPRWVSTDESTRSVMAAPMQTGGRLIGVLVIESDQIRAFAQRDLRLLQTLSSTLAAIVQNSRLLGEVQDANERLLEVDRLKTNFLAAMSHELRTPLNSIIGFSRVILKGIDGPLTDTQEQDITTIYDSGKHLLGLVNDILDQAKIEAKKMELSYAYFKMQDVVQSVMSSAIGLTRDKPVRLHTEIAEGLPNAYGDEFRTRQVLLNLISNATKFTDEGSITVSAFPVWDEGQQYVQVSVTDTGIGVAEKDIHPMFEPFQQVDNSLTRKAGGTGLGLPLAKSLVELQRGRIWVESQVGVGSTFSITLPIAPPPETEQESSPTPEVKADVPKASAPPDAHPRRQTIIVVESDVEVINLYRRYLSREGFEVLGIVNPDNVISAIHTHQPSLIMLDVNMHDQAGWDVLAQLKGIPVSANIPVIICSLNPDTQRGFEMGASEYLVKPFSEDQLLAALHRIADETSRQRILLVDDKLHTIQPFREALHESQRYEVLEAASGQEALEILQRPTTIDLVILDLRMPEIDGFVVLQTLRAAERTANIPVLVLTAEDVTAEERTMLEATELYRKDDLDEQHLLERVEARLGITREH